MQIDLEHASFPSPTPIPQLAHSTIHLSHPKVLACEEPRDAISWNRFLAEKIKQAPSLDAS